MIVTDRRRARANAHPHGALDGQSPVRHGVGMEEPQTRGTAPFRPGPSVSRRATALGLGGLALFQVALAAGAPWGRISYGGAHPGVLPRRLRTVSAGAAVLYAGSGLAVVGPRTPVRLRRHVLTGVTGLLAVGTVVNGLSPSWPERALWTPTAAVLALCAWRARGDG